MSALFRMLAFKLKVIDDSLSLINVALTQGPLLFPNYKCVTENCNPGVGGKESSE